MDEAAEPEVTHDSPTQLDDLLLAVVLQQFVEQALVDVLVVDDEPLCVVQRGFLGLGEVLLAPCGDFRDRALIKGFCFP